MCELDNMLSAKPLKRREDTDKDIGKDCELWEAVGFTGRAGDIMGEVFVTPLLGHKYSKCFPAFGRIATRWTVCTGASPLASVGQFVP